MIKQNLSRLNCLNLGGLLIIILISSGCAAFGTKTITKSSNLNTYEIKRLGYSQLASEEILNKIRPNTSNIYQSAIEEFYANKTVRIEKYNLTKFESIENIDTSEIIKLCKVNGLDGYLCTQIKYKFVDYYYMFIPIGQSEDAYVDVILFDKNGLQLLHTKHNTYVGNSYMMAPKAEQTVSDGTFGALKQISKEIEKSKRLK
jgi:hypothetical protein